MQVLRIKRLVSFKEPMKFWAEKKTRVWNIRESDTESSFWTLLTNVCKCVQMLKPDSWDSPWSYCTNISSRAISERLAIKDRLEIYERVLTSIKLCGVAKKCSLLYSKAVQIWGEQEAPKASQKPRSRVYSVKSLTMKCLWCEMTALLSS